MGELIRRWREALREQSPAAVATVIEGPGLGAKMLVTPEDRVGTAGNGDLPFVADLDDGARKRHFARNLWAAVSAWEKAWRRGTLLLEKFRDLPPCCLPRSRRQ